MMKIGTLQSVWVDYRDKIFQNNSGHRSRVMEDAVLTGPGGHLIVLKFFILGYIGQANKNDPIHEVDWTHH